MSGSLVEKFDKDRREFIKTRQRADRERERERAVESSRQQIGTGGQGFDGDI